MDDLAQTCRTCLNKEQKLLAISSLIESNCSIKDYFEKYLQINMSENDDLPSNVCLKCLNKLLDVRKFFIQCQDSENYLKLKLQIPPKNACAKFTTCDNVETEVKKGFEKLSKNPDKVGILNFENKFLDNGNDLTTLKKSDLNEEYLEIEELKNDDKFQDQSKFNDIENETSESYSSSDDFVHYEILEEYTRDPKISQSGFKTQMFKCSDCQETFEFFKNLQHHIRLCHDIKFLNTARITEIDHVLYESTKRFNKTALKCKYCQKKFAFRTNYNIHLRRHLQSKKQLNESCVCSICGKSFEDKRKLQKHTYRHNNKNNKVSCPICSKTFRARYHLNIHMNQHTGAKPFPCNICKKKFVSPSSLRLHKTLHEGKKIQCPMCDTKLAARTQLKLHMRMHTNERPYACTQCPKKYKQLCALKVHLATHSGIKSVQCEECSACFYTKNHLLSHKIKIHRPKRFHCNICPRQCPTPFLMKSHLSSVHKIYPKDLSPYEINNQNVS
ncbi:zinc finger protein 39-like isoform X2 [Condylostylus longicornis]|uniref:zinc finger protein 39-like isoform X2 n=1 Tax=Condylostylus longicornis TaxID=2530218 RepID=UPI00244E23C7|nr:zinc finger protein 39-like isoform X2 [Condylostylus longicornis]